jgi:hypothetical protein
MFTLYKELTQAECDRIEADAEKRAKERATDESKIFTENADGTYEIGGQEYFCFTEKNLVSLISGVIKAQHIPDEF